MADDYDTEKLLDEAISLGRDFAGRVPFRDVIAAVKCGRFEILVCHRRDDKPWTGEVEGTYELVLKARH